MRASIFLSAALMVSTFGYSQPDTIYNTKSTEKIPYYEQLYRFRVWRTVDFQEKQNSGFKSPSSDMVKFIVDNLQSGVLKGYQPNDFFFAETQKVEDFLVKSRIQGTPAYDANKDYYSQEQVSYNGKVYSSSTNGNKGHLPTDQQWWAEVGDEVEFLKSGDIQTMSLVEDVIFDRRRSRLYYDILGFVLTDNDGNPRALVNYREFYDLVEKTAHSKDMKLRKSVFWKNRYNPSEDKTFTDALKLRLFHGIIEKVENPDDRTILEIYTLNKRTYGESVFARWEEEMKLMEKEHNLWEY